MTVSPHNDTVGSLAFDEDRPGCYGHKFGRAIGTSSLGGHGHGSRFRPPALRGRRVVGGRGRPGGVPSAARARRRGGGDGAAGEPQLRGRGGGGARPAGPGGGG